MGKKLLLIFFFACFTKLSAQEFIKYNGSASYPATKTWDFICERYALSGITQIQVAKTEKGGVLKITVDTTNPDFIIAGTLYLDLIDNTVITCLDKKIREIQNNQITSYYFLSSIEMNKLKITDIQYIRFYIKGNQDQFSSQTGNFTAINRMKYFSTAFDKTKKSYNTAAEISDLYK